MGRIWETKGNGRVPGEMGGLREGLGEIAGMGVNREKWETEGKWGNEGNWEEMGKTGWDGDIERKGEMGIKG